MWCPRKELHLKSLANGFRICEWKASKESLHKGKKAAAAAGKEQTFSWWWWWRRLLYFWGKWSLEGFSWLSPSILWKWRTLRCHTKAGEGMVLKIQERKLLWVEWEEAQATVSRRVSETSYSKVQTIAVEFWMPCLPICSSLVDFVRLPRSWLTWSWTLRWQLLRWICVVRRIGRNWLLVQSSSPVTDWYWLVLFPISELCFSLKWLKPSKRWLRSEILMVTQ